MSRYFSNGTEGAAWMAEWCDRCENDHGMHHGGDSSSCLIMTSHMAGVTDEVPEWVDLSDEKGFTLPPAVSCLSFAPCRYCDPNGPQGPPPPPVPKPIPGQLTLLDSEPAEVPVAVGALL